MPLDTLLQSSVTGSVALIALAAMATANASDLTVTDAKIAGGKLVITGTTAAPNTWVRLDAQTARDFNVKSGADAAFAFGIVYHPGDCIVDLQRVVSPTSLGAATAAVVADCGPAGVSPRGPWSPTTPYVANDLVTYLGSTWRARRSNVNKLPVSGVDWEQFAAAGDEIAGSMDAQKAPPDGPAGGDLTGNYPNPTIANSAVTSIKIANGSIAFADIANNAIGSVNIADGQVLSQDVRDDTVAGGGLVAADLGPNSVGASELQDGSVNSLKVINESLTASDLATDSVNATEIANDSIDSGEIADNSLFDDDLAANSVGNSELQDNAVGTANIINSTITGADVANNSLTTADIFGASINGQVNLANVPNGRCVQVNFAVPGSVVGEAVVIALNGAVQNGIILYPQRVSANGTVQANICNFTGAAMNPIVDMPVKIITFN